MSRSGVRKRRLLRSPTMQQALVKLLIERIYKSEGARYHDIRVAPLTA